MSELEQRRAAASYQAQQRVVSSSLVRDIVKLLRLLFNIQEPEQSWPGVQMALAAMVFSSRERSASLAGPYYRQLRTEAGVPGEVVMAEPRELTQERLTEALGSAGMAVMRKSVRLGATSAQARDRMAVTLSGTATRLALEGGRDVMEATSHDDEEALGWARIGDGDPCSWCAMLISRGAVYESAGTAGDSRYGGAKYHDHCVPAGTLVDGPTAEIGYRREYEGELVVINSAAGHELRITPNHPVLTDCGWVPAGLLREGDQILSSFNAQGNLLPVPDEEYVPSLVEDVWGALRVDGLVRVPGSAENFHGDGSDCEVDVVGPDSLLRDNARVVDVAGELLLTFSRMAEGSFPLAGPQGPLLDGDNPATDYVMRRPDPSAPFLGREFGHSENSRFGEVADGHACLDEAVVDDTSGDAVTLSDFRFSAATLVGSHQLLDGEVLAVSASSDSALLELSAQGRLGDSEDLLNVRTGSPREIETDGPVEGLGVGFSVPRFDPPGDYGHVDSRNAYARLGGDLIKRLAGRVQMDRIVEIRRVNFSGHVFNFQTQEGWYRANGIIVSNCGCQAVPIFDADSPLLHRADTLFADWKRVTAGTGGDEARKVWRQWWEGRAGSLPPGVEPRTQPPS